MNVLFKLFLNGKHTACLAIASVVVLAGCASAERKPLVQGPTTTAPLAADAAPANPGSLFPASAGATGRYKPLFEDPRARNIGDIVTVALAERTVANRSSNASATKESSFGVEADLGSLTNLGNVFNGSTASSAGRRASAFGQTLDGLGASGSTEFQGRGAASASNAFTGTITTTVIEVLPNGNLVIAGEKQLAVSSEEEVIRISGVVNPTDLVNNQVTSTRIADLRLEYRGKGFGDDTQRPGWFTGMWMKISPF
jgi:flagellar L-ring protein FlgH